MHDDIFAVLHAAGVKKLGLMGGTFDPIHKTHVAMAETAKAQFGLDAVVFLVSGDPPHKRANANEEQRYAMLQLAVAGREGLYPSRIELGREGKTYTADTLSAIKAQMPGTELFYLVGIDTLYSLKDGWRNSEKVCELTSFIAFDREEPTRDSGELPKGCRVQFAVSEANAVSSTSVRRRITQQLPVDGLIEPAVEEYIAANSLYTACGMTFGEAQAAVKAMIPEDRYIHTLGVVETSAQLAKRNGVNVNKARWAALLHDCAKAMPMVEALQIIDSHSIEIDPVTRMERSLLHAPAGAALARDAFGIDDQEILDAIACHTTGKRDMTTLDKILYVADAIEPNRSYPGVDELRAAAAQDLDRSILAYMDQSIRYILKKGVQLHPNTVDGRNQLVIQLKSKG